MKSFIEKVKTFFINFMNADKAVQIRTVAFFTSLIAMIAQTFFKKELVLNPETITNYIIEFGVVILGTRSWWKNNSLRNAGTTLYNDTYGTGCMFTGSYNTANG